MILKVSLGLVVIAIAYLSLTPSDTLTIGNDKISHFIAYGTLMFNSGLLTFHEKNKFIRAIFLCVLYGVLIEIAQHFVPGRFMSIYDIIANVAGVVIGCILTVLLNPIVSRLLGKGK